VMILKLTKKLEFSEIAEKTGQDSRNPRKGRPPRFWHARANKVWR